MQTLGIRLTADAAEMIRQISLAEKSITGMTTGVQQGAATAQTAVEKLGAALGGIGGKGRIDAARGILDIRSFRDIQREISQVDAAFLRLARSGALSMGELNQASAAHQAKVAALRAEMVGLGRASGVSAGQTANAMRMLPAQFTDVATQLAGGQNPFLVLLQQGGQVKDMFGGFRPMFKGLAAAITPAVLGFGALAVGVGGALAALVMGQSESNALNRSLRLTGNAAGLTGESARALARDVSSATGATIGLSKEAVSAAIAMGNVGAPAIGEVAKAIAAYAKAADIAVEEAAPLFKGIGTDAVAWALKMTESTNFLTVSTYAQVKALQDQGRAQEAASVAAAALKAKLDEQPVSLGWIESALKSAKAGWSEFWDSAMGLGRPEEVGAKIDALQAKINGLGMTFMERLKNNTQGFLGGEKNPGVQLLDLRNDGQKAEALATAKQEHADQQEMQRMVKRSADAEANTAAKNRAQVAALQFTDALRLETGAQAKLSKEVEAAQRHFASLEGTKQAVSAADQARMLNSIRRRNQDTEAIAASGAASAYAVAQARISAEAALRVEDKKMADLDAMRAMGLVSERDYIERSLSIEMSRLDSKRKLIEEERRIEAGRAVNQFDPAAVTGKRTNLANLDAQKAAVIAQAVALPPAAAVKVGALDLSDARASAAEWGQLFLQASEKANALVQQAAIDQAQLITNPTERARAVAEANITAMQADAARMVAVWDIALGRIDAAAAIAKAKGDADAAASLQGRADDLRKHRDAVPRLTDDAAQRQRFGVADQLIASDPTAGLTAGWDNTTKAIGGAVAAMQSMGDAQDTYAAAMRAAQGDAARLGALESKRLIAQAGGYANVVGAMKGYFKAGSVGYKAMEKAERSFRSIELALALKSALEKMGLFGAITTAKVAGDAMQASSAVSAAAVDVAASQAQGQAAAVAGVAAQAKGDPYTAFARMAAMAAAMAALGYLVGGGFNRGGVKVDPGNTGTGTVLGDSSAQSKSLANSIERLRDVDTMTMRYSAQMLASLQNIEAALGGVASLLVRNGQIANGGAFGVQTGTARYKGDPLLNALGLGQLNKLFTSLPVIGGVIERLQGLWGKTTQSITGSGLMIGGSFSDLQRGEGFNQYADISKTSSSFFGLSKKTSNDTLTQRADDATAAQFGMVFRGIQSALEAAAGPLGKVGADVAAQLAQIPVDIGKVNLNGLTGTQIQEKLSAVIGAAADRLAEVAFPGLREFQAIGEGYFETVTRVASQTEQARVALERMGLRVPDLAGVANKTGDLGAELVRLGIMTKEAGSSVGDLVGVLQGSAADIADTYNQLADIRASFQALGISGQAVTSALLSGAGGLDQLASGLSDFESEFLSEGEQRAVKAARLARQFDALGIAMPSSAAAFKALVMGMDTSTAAGQKLLGGVLALSGGFADMQGAMADLGKGIEDEINRIRGLITSRSSAGQLQAQFAIATAQARAGDTAAIDALPGLSKALLDAAAAESATRLDLVRTQARTAASLEETLAIVRGSVANAGEVPGFTAIGAGVTANTPAQQPGGTDKAEMAALLAEVSALRGEVKRAREESFASGSAIAASSAKVARIMERITPDGDALATRETA